MLIFLPILQEDKAFGGLVVLFDERRDFEQEELELLDSLSDQAALAIGNERLRAQAEELAIISERTRLARDLHDAVTQTLFSASLIAEALPSLWHVDQQEGEGLLNELRQLNRGALAEMRTLLMELRPASIVESELGELLAQLGESISGRMGIPVDLDIDGLCHKLPEDVHIGLYRIAQESLSNIVRHAGASHITLHLSCVMIADLSKPENDKIKVLLEVTDDGCGFDIKDVAPGRFGLINLRERAEGMGADLKISSQLGEGTQVSTSWDGPVRTE